MVNKLLILLLLSVSVFAQSNIDKLRNTISEINTGFLYSNLPDENKLQLIETTLSLIESSEREKIDITEVRSEFFNYKELLKHEQNVDSLKKAFRSVNNRFNSVAYNYFYDKLIKSSKQKILVFSTSMSCECTLEMCYQQEVEVQKFCKENNYEYAVIDTWEDFEIQQKFKVGFVPTVILLDPDNNELKRFTRMENLYPQLSSLVN
ncbi:MAG: hypothetical protein U5K00_04795 [Melioribacteraceae bacterium]|nr:hypothetical protein [Melioribacteraceae bacterium]